MSTLSPRQDGARSSTPQPRHSREDPLPNLLGWGSLGLGVPQLSSPGRFDEAIGVKADRESRAWTLVVGVRELAAAAGILLLERPRPVGWLWARVGGDVMDLALLGAAFRSKRADTGRLLGSIGAVAGITVADVVAAVRFSRSPDLVMEDQTMELRASATIRRPREEVYRFWHELQNLPRFMAHLESVQMNRDGRSHWRAKAPLGTVEWDAEVVQDRPAELIAWRSLPGADVDNSGVVRFMTAPGDRGTEVHLEMRYDIPAGRLGEIVAKLFGEEPHQQVKDDLRRFKQVMETGEVVRSDGTPEGTSSRRLFKQRPAHPVEEPASVGGRSS
jgi:uncharacterized membrane protein